MLIFGGRASWDDVHGCGVTLLVFAALLGLSVATKSEAASGGYIEDIHLFKLDAQYVTAQEFGTKTGTLTALPGSTLFFDTGLGDLQGILVETIAPYASAQAEFDMIGNTATTLDVELSIRFGSGAVRLLGGFSVGLSNGNACPDDVPSCVHRLALGQAFLDGQRYPIHFPIVGAGEVPIVEGTTDVPSYAIEHKFPLPGGAVQSLSITYKLPIEQMRFGYQAKTTQEYVVDAIVRSRPLASTDMLIAQAAIGSQQTRGSIIALRNSGAGGTSADNLALRDAERWFYGYAAGRFEHDRSPTNMSPFFIDFVTCPACFEAWQGGVAGNAIYNGVKAAGRFVDIVFFQSFLPPSVQNGQNTVSSDRPGSPVGGFAAHWAGYTAGLAGAPLGAFADGTYDPLNHPFFTFPFTIASTPAAPLRPAQGFQVLSSDGFLINGGIIPVQVSGQDWIYIDPSPAALMVYGVDENLFSALLVPTTAEQKLLSAKLLLGTQEISIAGDQVVNFLDLGVGAVDGFALTDLVFVRKPSDFVIGLKFASDGEAVVAAIGVAPVPEPSSWVLIVTGVVGMAVCSRLRRRTAGADGVRETGLGAEL